MSRLNHSFSVEHAELYGIECAIIIHHFQFWIEQNKRLGKNFYEGKTWVYQTQKEIAAVYPYWSEDVVYKLLKKMVVKGILIKKNFNRSQFDRTQWYAFSDEMRFSIPSNDGMESVDLRNGNRKTTESIYDIDTKEKDTKQIENKATGVALSAEADDLLNFFIEKIKERKSDFKFPKNLNRWKKEIDEMIRLDKRDPKKIRAMIDWIHKDSFWCSNILSPEKLRKQYDQIDLQAKGKFEKNIIQQNREYVMRISKKYPESFKNLVIAETYVINQGKGKELVLKMNHESFKRAFMSMFGTNYEDMAPGDR